MDCECKNEGCKNSEELQNYALSGNKQKVYEKLMQGQNPSKCLLKKLKRLKKDDMINFIINNK